MKTLLLALLLTASAFAVGPKYGPRTQRLFEDRAHFQKSPAPDFWALIPYYVGQFNGSACSVATATTVLNAVRARQTLKSDEELLDQEGLLRLLNDPQWNKGVYQGGGVTLDELGDILRRLLVKLGHGGATVEAVHVDDQGTETATRFRAVLEQNEKSDRDFLIFNFLQRTFVDDPQGGGGHFAPVGAYDAVRRRILVLDPYRRDYEPYWVEEAVALAGMNTKDSSINANRGYLWVRLP